MNSGRGMCEGSAHMVPYLPKKIMWCMWLNWKYRSANLAKDFELIQAPCGSHLQHLRRKRIGFKLLDVLKFQASNIQTYFIIRQHATFTIRIKHLNVTIINPQTINPQDLVRDLNLNPSHKDLTHCNTRCLQQSTILVS